MVRNGQISVADARRVLRRYWWILLITVSSGLIAAMAAAMILPKKYTSTTMVLVDQPTVPTDYIKPVVSADLNNRLASMKQQILSRSRLQPIIEKFGLYPKERNKLPMDMLVEKLRNDVDVAILEAMAGTHQNQPSGFRVAVTFDNPQTAQQICSELTSMFIEKNVDIRERQSAETTTFLTQQLDEAKAKLDEQDTNLAQFKRKYLGALPDQEQTNLSLLNGMNSQLEANTQALSRAQQDKAYNESQLSQQQALWRSAQSGHNPETQEQQLLALQNELSVLESRYTPEHPDVIKLKGQIEEMKKRISESSKDTQANVNKVHTEPAAAEPPQIQQIRAALRQDDLTIAELTHEQKKVQEQISILQSRVQASPAVEQQYKELTRNYQTALEFYNDLLRKRDNSAIATDLEHKQQSEQFRVLDAPSLPSSPSSPKKPVLVGGGFVGGFGLGLGILYLIALSDKTLHSERDVETCLKLPVLTMVPLVEFAGIGNSIKGQPRESRLELQESK